MFKLLKKYSSDAMFAISGLLFMLSTEQIPWKLWNSKCTLNISQEEECEYVFTSFDSILFWLGLVCFFIATSIFVSKEYLKSKKKPKTVSLKNKLWETELRAFVDNIGLTYKDRISLYVYEKKTGRFFKAGRDSKNNDYKNGGRKSYKGGVVEKAFHETSFAEKYSADPGLDRDKWVEEVIEKSKFSKNVVEKLNMPTRYLYGRKIEKLNGDAIGVLLFETTNIDSSHISYTTSNPNKKLTQTRLEDIFKRECRRFSYYLDEFEVPVDIWSFEEESLNGK